MMRVSVSMRMTGGVSRLFVSGQYGSAMPLGLPSSLRQRHRAYAPQRHTKAHLLRAAQEGIAFSFAYGMQIMQQMGMHISTIKAGHANLFLSPIFRKTLATVAEADIHLYQTDGSVGAAYGAGIGAHIFADADEAFATLKRIDTITPDPDSAPYKEAYQRWTDRCL